MHTSRSGVVAFRNSYHGLTYGALAVTHRAHFRAPFEAQLFPGVRFASYPDHPGALSSALDEIDDIMATAEASEHPIGCIIVEPIQGRGGIVVPPPDFLAQLRERCDGRRCVLIFDEIYTGMGRTGRWLTSEHWGVVPDIAVIGKALTGALPLSAAIGSRAVMESWPASTGEAIHTSTFIGNPIACAAALAQIDEIEKNNLLERAQTLGKAIRAYAARWKTMPSVRDVRGLGLLQGVVLHDPRVAAAIVNECLQRGVLLLLEGTQGDVLAITPPAVITDAQLNHALGIIEQCLQAAA
jgi:4-aminobutyrate aminotransferase / (S)-3-amino-2-methylpropionate transaminase / 5-aminovalerate transaminase